jgi:hypothetical protein
LSAATAAGPGGAATAGSGSTAAPAPPNSGPGAAPAAGLEVLLMPALLGSIMMVLMIRIYIGRGIIVVVTIRFMEKIRLRRIIRIIVIIPLIGKWIAALAAVVSSPDTTCQNKGQPQR